MITKLKILSLGLLLSTLNLPLYKSYAQGTAFTYQGRLNDSANLAKGNYDVAFTLFATNVTGVAVAGPVTNAAVAVSNGLFTTTVDFGNQFPGAARWLELAVRTNGANVFTTLTPRQALTATPYAINAATAMFAGLAASAASVPAANITGTFTPAQLPQGLLTNGGTVTNIFIMSSTLWGTNIYTFTNNMSHASGSPYVTTTDGAFKNLMCGDQFVWGNNQFWIERVLSAGVMIVRPRTGVAFTGSTTNVIYPAPLHGFDINGSGGFSLGGGHGTPTGSTESDGTVKIVGGGNSGSLEFVNEYGDDWRGRVEQNGTFNFYHSRTNSGGAGNNEPNVIQIDPQNNNNYEAVRIFQTGAIKTKYGFTNDGPTVITGSLQITAATNTMGTTVKCQLPIIVNGVTYYIDLKQ